jgi:hypothetical protein
VLSIELAAAAGLASTPLRRYGFAASRVHQAVELTFVEGELFRSDE